MRLPDKLLTKLLIQRSVERLKSLPYKTPTPLPQNSLMVIAQSLKLAEYVRWSRLG